MTLLKDFLVRSALEKKNSFVKMFFLYVLVESTGLFGAVTSLFSFLFF